MCFSNYWRATQSSNLACYHAFIKSNNYLQNKASKPLLFIVLFTLYTCHRATNIAHAEAIQAFCHIRNPFKAWCLKCWHFAIFHVYDVVFCSAFVRLHYEEWIKSWKWVWRHYVAFVSLIRTWSDFLSRDEAIYRSSHSNDVCWNVLKEITTHELVVESSVAK
jgi:hypothetical protein